MPLAHADTEWRTLSVTKKIDPDAATFKVWVCLLLDKGTIRPDGVTIYFSAVVEAEWLLGGSQRITGSAKSI